MGSRTWIKIYCDKWLSGTLREESPELRGIWADLLALAGSGLYGDTGEIRLQNGIGLTDLQLQKLLNVSKYQWRKSKKRLLETERIAINSLGAIRILNWGKYQSEYERQKPYRNPKLQQVVTQEIEKEIEIEKRSQALKKSPDPLNESRKLIFEGLQERRGINSPVPGAEAKAMTWMLKEGYIVQHILDAYDALKSGPFWTDKFLSMQSVKKQIGEVFKKKESAEKTQIKGVKIISEGEVCPSETKETGKIKGLTIEK